MEEITKVDPIYTKGFEHGYWLQRGNSKDLDAVLESSKGDETYHNGLKAGRKEAEREKVRERLHSHKEQSTDPETGMDMD